MATVSANKMSSLIKKGKLPGLQVVRLIHQHCTDGFNGKEPIGFTEADLKNLASNLDHREWRGVSHWVDGGIDLLYAFAMTVKSDAALVAAEIHQLNTFHAKVTQFDNTKISSEKWEAKALSIRASIHRVLWYHEALRVVDDYMNADWSLIASRGMKSMHGAIELINETIIHIEADAFKPFDMNGQKPSEEVVEDWRQKVKELNIRNFLLVVAEGEIEYSFLHYGFANYLIC